MSRLPILVPSRPKRFSKKERALAGEIRNDKNIDCSFDDSPIISAIDKNAGTLLPSEVVAGSELSFSIGKDTFEMHNAVVETTGTAVYSFPSLSSDGLEIVGDADVTDGVTAYELSNGILSTSRSSVTVGTDEDMEFEVAIKIDDVTDLDQVFIGFRKAEAYQAEPDNYDELCAFHIGETGATVADGQINIASILNGGATSYHDSTESDFADGESKTFKIVIKNNGQAEFSIDGNLPVSYPQFTFDSAEEIVPFVFVENTSGSTAGDPGVSISSWKLGKRGL